MVDSSSSSVVPPTLTPTVMDSLGSPTSSTAMQGRRGSHQMLPPIATEFTSQQPHTIPVLSAALSDSSSAHDETMARYQSTRHAKKDSSSSSTSKTAAFFGSSDSLAPVLPSTLGSTGLLAGADQNGLTRHASNSSTSSWTHMGPGGAARRWDDFEGKPITPLPSPGIMAGDHGGGETVEMLVTADGHSGGNYLSAAGPFDAAFGRRRRAASSTGSSSEGAGGGRGGVGGGGGSLGETSQQQVSSSGSLNGSLSNFDVSLSDDSIAHMTSLPSLPSQASTLGLHPNSESSSVTLSPARGQAQQQQQQYPRQDDAASSSSSPPKQEAWRRGASSSTSASSGPSSSSTSSKTSNFFGASWSISSAPTTQSYSTTEREQEAAVVASPMSAGYLGSPASQKREPPPSSSASRLHDQQASSRYPSAPSDGDIDGLRAPFSSGRPVPVRAFDSISALPSAIGDAPSLLPSQAPTVELHTPPSPTIEVSSSWSRDGRGGQVGRSSRSRGTSSTRHVHGPSENATGSSFLPSVEAVKSAGALFVKDPLASSTIKDVPANGPASVASAGEAAVRRDSARDQAGLIGAAKAAVSEAEATEEEEDEVRGIIGPYSVERTLGVGAFSRVVLAARKAGTPPPPPPSNGSTDKRSSVSVSRDLVALKMLERAPCMQNERMKVSWVREVEVLKHIVHPNIVRFISSFSTPRHHNLVLERVGGGELFELLANHALELAKREWLVRRLFGELANAVGWMHAINLVHRDIKLENIILTFDLFSTDLRPSTLGAGPLLKLTDFGLSRFIDPNSPLLETRCGSEEYAAPELIIGKRYDGRKTDAWAMGVVLYALLTGCLPFLEDTTSSTATTGGVGREGQGVERDAKARKTHLLRIAKGDLRWPARDNDQSLDVSPGEQAGGFAPNNRLVTSRAKHMVGRLLRRDAAKRATAWETWDEEWMTEGSFAREASAHGDEFEPPLDPRSAQGQRWLLEHARVHSGAAELAHDD